MKLDLEPALRAKLAAFEKQQLVRAEAEGRRAVRLEFAPSPERAAAGQSINTVRERLAPIAEIVKVLPVSLPATAQAPGGLAFVLLLVTSATDEELARRVGRPGLVGPDHRAQGAARAPRGERSCRSPTEAGPELPEEPADRRNVLRVEVSRVDDAMEKLSSLIVSRSRLARSVAALDASTADTRELKQIGIDIARQIRDLRSAILNVRMVRVGEILERVPLVVRGLRRATGKHVRLEMDVGDAELDKAVAERIFPAILHLVRNAVDHGLENPEERRAMGKPEEGLIRITTSSRSNTQLELVVSDDGRGVDGERVAARAGAERPDVRCRAARAAVPAGALDARRGDDDERARHGDGHRPAHRGGRARWRAAPLHAARAWGPPSRSSSRSRSRSSTPSRPSAARSASWSRSRWSRRSSRWISTASSPPR